MRSRSTTPRACQGEPVETGANPITRAVDVNGTLGGPIVRDKAWFFTAYRYWVHDQEVSVPADYTGPQPVDDNRIRNLSGKFTWQASDNDRIAVTLQRNWKQRFHRRDNPYRAVPDELARFQDQWADNYIASYNRVLGDAALLDIRLGKMTGVTPYILYTEYCGIPVDEYPDAGPCTENDISVIDPVRAEQFNADRRGEYWGPNHRNQFNGSLTYYLDSESGSHNFKVGGQASREYKEDRVFKSGDAYGILEDGVPTQVNISRTPQTSHTRLNTWAFYAQDAWTIGDRLTLNLGVRLDGIYGYLPVQSSPAGTWSALSEQLSDAVFEVTSEIQGLPDWPMNIGPRLSFAYDLFGDGRAALKGGWGRYYTQTGSALLNSANPNAGASANVGWNDLDGDKLVDLGPSGTPRGQPRNRPLHVPRLHWWRQHGVRQGREPAVQRRHLARYRHDPRFRRLVQRHLPPSPPSRFAREAEPGPSSLRLRPDLLLVQQLSGAVLHGLRAQGGVPRPSAERRHERGQPQE